MFLPLNRLNMFFKPLLWLLLFYSGFASQELYRIAKYEDFQNGLLPHPVKNRRGVWQCSSRNHTGAEEKRPGQLTLVWNNEKNLLQLCKKCVKKEVTFQKRFLFQSRVL